jgi:hypothetical protein
MSYHKRLEVALEIISDVIKDMKAEGKKVDDRMEANLPPALVNAEDPPDNFSSMSDGEIAEALLQMEKEARQAGGSMAAILARIDEAREVLGKPSNLIPIRSDDPKFGINRRPNE